MTIKPLREVQRPSQASTIDKATKANHSIDDYEPHSKHRAEHSKHYHEVTIGKTDTGQYGDKAIAKLNPTKAAPSVRSFPGIVS